MALSRAMEMKKGKRRKPDESYDFSVQKLTKGMGRLFLRGVCVKVRKDNLSILRYPIFPASGKQRKKNRNAATNTKQGETR